MKAVITGENDERVGVNLLDNNGVEHVIEMEFDGKIKYHEAGDYPDEPSERTEADNEHVNQARRFAKYWVYRKRGYDTLEPLKNPDRIAQAALALLPLTAEAAEEYFGDLYQHFQSISGDAESPLEMPEGVTPAEAVYQKDIYVGMDDETATTYAEVLTDPAVVDLLESEATEAGELPETLDPATIAGAAGVDLGDLPNIQEGALIEAVSDIHVHWDDVLGEYHTQWGDRPEIDRDPHARIEIFRFDPDSILELNQQVVRHLLCQVRDCYISMGIAPPKQFRLLGHGRHDASTWYNHYDFYEEYFDTGAEIDTWYEEHTPDDAYEHDATSQRIQPEA